MEHYWDDYTLKEFLYELGELSCIRREMMKDLNNMVHLQYEYIDLLETLSEGKVNNIFKLNELVDSIIEKDLVSHNLERKIEDIGSQLSETKFKAVFHEPSSRSIQIKDKKFEYRQCNNCKSDKNVKELVLGEYNSALCQDCREELTRLLVKEY